MRLYKLIFDYNQKFFNKKDTIACLLKLSIKIKIPILMLARIAKSNLRIAVLHQLQVHPRWRKIS